MTSAPLKLEQNLSDFLEESGNNFVISDDLAVIFDKYKDDKSILNHYKMTKSQFNEIYKSQIKDNLDKDKFKSKKITKEITNYDNTTIEQLHNEVQVKTYFNDSHKIEESMKDLITNDNEASGGKKKTNRKKGGKMITIE